MKISSLLRSLWTSGFCERLTKKSRDADRTDPLSFASRLLKSCSGEIIPCRQNWHSRRRAPRRYIHHTATIHTCSTTRPSQSTACPPRPCARRQKLTRCEPKYPSGAPELLRPAIINPRRVLAGRGVPTPGNLLQLRFQPDTDNDFLGFHISCSYDAAASAWCLKEFANVMRAFSSAGSDKWCPCEQCE